MKTKDASTSFASLSSSSLYAGLYFSWLCISVYFDLSSCIETVRKMKKILIAVVLILSAIIYDFLRYVFEIHDRINVNKPYLDIVIIFTYKWLLAYGIAIYSYRILYKYVNEMFEDSYRKGFSKTMNKFFIYFSILYIGSTTFEFVFYISDCFSNKSQNLIVVLYYTMFEIFPCFVFFIATLKVNSSEFSSSILTYLFETQNLPQVLVGVEGREFEEVID